LTTEGLQEIFFAAYRWVLPLSPNSVDYRTLRAWGSRSTRVVALVRGGTWRSQRQELSSNVEVATSPAGGVPFIGLACYALWLGGRYARERARFQTRLHASDPIGAVLTDLCSRLRKPDSRVVHVQGPFFDPPPILGIKGRVLAALQRFGSRRADVVRCVSSDIREAGIKRGLDPKRLAVAWSRIDVEDFAGQRLAAEASESSLITVARLTPRKGVHLLIEALARIDHVPVPTLVVAGDGPEEKRLKQLARDLSVQATFLGRVPYPTLPSVLSKSAIFALPSLADATPRALMEAMAAGCAVVVSNVGDMAEMVGDAGIVTPRGDTLALTTAIMELATDASKRLRLGVRARQRAHELFSFEPSMDELWQLGLPSTARA
jgi:glycosyltransferase involved in cell wall biosynthesis